MHEFSEGYTLKVKEDSAIHSVELPQEVYEKLIQEDFGDICVFNGKGDPVPYFLRAVHEEKPGTDEREAIPFFPLSFHDNKQDDKKEDFSVRVSRNSSGTIVKVSPLTDTPFESGVIDAYLLDLSNVERQISELEFDWDKNDSATLIKLTIEQSDDLVTWSKLWVKASLANIHYMGNRVIRRKIALGMDTKKYLKVSWAPLKYPFKVTEVVGHFSTIPGDTGSYWTKAISVHQVSEENKTIAQFKLESKIQPDRVQVIFPEKHSLMKLSILSKKTADETWTSRCDALFYDFRLEGTGLRNEPCLFPGTLDNEWGLAQDDNFSNGINKLGKLKIKLGWRRHELLFVSQGEPPFLLAYGSGKFTSKTSSVRNDSILNALLDDPMKREIQRAEIVEKVELGGEKALLLPATPLPWKKWILWFVLIAGVFCLAYMVRNLLSELKHQKRG